MRAQLALVLHIGALIGSVSSTDYWNSMQVCHMSSCASTVSNASVLDNFCYQQTKTFLDGRCCIKHHEVEGLEEENIIVGLDLSMCDLKSLGAIFESINTFLERRRLQMLIVNENPLENCSAQYFSGMSTLQYLSLPANCECPGGKSAWYNISQENDTNTCSGLKNICTLSNVTCPEYSHCELHSPGFTWCVCNDGYYGYKCLRSGTFPSELFGFLLAGGAVFFSGFCWFLFRKHVLATELKEIKEQ